MHTVGEVPLGGPRRVVVKQLPPLQQSGSSAKGELDDCGRVKNCDLLIQLYIAIHSLLED